MASVYSRKLTSFSALRCALFAIALVALIAASGCGGAVKSTGTTPTTTTAGPTTPAAKKAYEDDVADALEPVISASQLLATQAPSAASAKDLAPQLETAAAAYSNATTTLSQMNPPAEIKALHVRLTKASRSLAAATTAAQQAAEKNDKKGMAAFADAGQKYQDELTKLQSEFLAAGYEFGTTTTSGTTTTPTTPGTATTPTTPTTPGTATEPITPGATPTVPTTPTTPTTPSTTKLPDPKDLKGGTDPASGAKGK
ncbi:MAG: hypothetical protein QOG62_1397 [Thermoleophilaceae bacterium]|jgi:hypothetical protein|nr:hypothetical protein [Thermoleophilaceae bacterium]